MAKGKKTTSVRIAIMAKAGRRAAPAARRGKHITTPEQRARGRFLSQFGIKPYKNPWTANNNPKSSVSKTD